MKNLNIALFAIILLPSVSFAGQSLEQILDNYYPNYDRNEECLIYNSFNKSTEAYEKFCVKYNKQKTVTTTNGKRLYLLTQGYSLERGTSNFRKEMVGLITLKPDEKEGGWLVESANPFMIIGQTQEMVQNWEFRKFSPTVYGFLGNHSYGINGGTSYSDMVIITPNDKSSLVSKIDTHFDNNATYSCESNKLKCDNISARVDINHSIIQNNFYPLDVIVNGKLDNKVYKNKTYRINYQKGKGYSIPKNYILNKEENESIRRYK